ncbi:MAG: SPOR domain-containing protein [Rhodospirillaceae bacterium]
MSFRFVGTALTILSTSTASGLYLASGSPATAPHAPTVVVPVVQAEAPPPAPVKAVVRAGDVWRPRIWVGTGSTINPVTGEPLTHEEQETGWVDGPNTFAREIVRTVADPLSHAPKAVHEPNPEVMVLPPGKKAPAWANRSDVALAPGVMVEDPPPPPAPAPPPPPAPAAARTEAGYRIHLESYRDERMVAHAWAALQKANPAVLGSLDASTMTVTVPKKGKFVRLLAGAFGSKAEAEKACAALKKAHRAQYCHPQAPSRETS